MRWLLCFVLVVICCALPGHSQSAVPRPGVVGAATPAVQATIYSQPRCAPCLKLIEAVQEDMPDAGWVVRQAAAADAAKAHILIQKFRVAISPEIRAFPTTVLRRDGKEVERLEGAITTTKLAERINARSKP